MKLENLPRAQKIADELTKIKNLKDAIDGYIYKDIKNALTSDQCMEVHGIIEGMLDARMDALGQEAEEL
jgi:hypothetical protein